MAVNPTGSRADDAVLCPVRTGNAFEETVERLLQVVRLGVVGPGDRLPAERELATRLNVSRVTLRDAIRALAEAGYLTSRRGRYGGTFVASSAPPAARGESGLGRPAYGVADLEDVLVLRHALEVGAAEAAARRRLGDDERDQLRARRTECSAAVLGAYRRTDSRLHLAIAEASGSASLIRAVADARTRVNQFLDAIPLLELNLTHSDDQHATIVTAILDGDPERARTAMAEHLEGTAALLRGFLA